MSTNDVYGGVMLAELRVSQWTARKQDKRVAEAVAQANQVDQRVGAYYKSLLDPEVIEAIKKIVSRARVYHYRMTLPWTDDGPRILPAKLYFEYTAGVAKLKDEFVKEVEALLKDYPYYREEAKRYLGGLFNDDDYPTPDELSKKYAFNVRMLPLPRGADFRCDIPQQDLAQLRTDIEAEAAESLRRATEDAFNRTYEVVLAFVDRLADPTTVFRDSLVSNARELLEILPALNVTGDPELARMCEVLEKELTIYDPSVLRTNMGARKQVYEAAKSAVSDMENVFGCGA